MENTVFFRRFFNVTVSTTVDFAVGIVEGVIEANFTTQRDGSRDELRLFGAENMVQDKVSKILSISAGGAIVKTTTVVAKTIARALPTYYI
jgi:hypothetical protein